MPFSFLTRRADSRSKRSCGLTRLALTSLLGLALLATAPSAATFAQDADATNRATITDAAHGPADDANGTGDALLPVPETITTSGVPEIPHRVLTRLDRYRNTRTANLVRWLPGDQGLIVRSRLGTYEQLYRVERPGAMRQQLTYFDRAYSWIWTRPGTDGRTVVVSGDTDGDGKEQIYISNADRERTVRISDGTSRYGFPGWSPTGRYLAYFSSERNGRDRDIYIARVNDDGDVTKTERVVEEGGVWFPLGWAPDDSRLLVLEYRQFTDSRIHVYTRATGTLTQISPSEGTASHGYATFGDPNTVYFTSSEGSGTSALHQVVLDDAPTAGDTASETVRSRAIISTERTWPVENLNVSQGGRYVAYSTNHRGTGRLHVFDTETGVNLDLPELPTGSIYSLRFNAEATKLGLYLSTAQSPGDVYSIDLNTRTLTRWTHSEIGGLSTDAFVAPSLIQYATFDRAPSGETRMIDAFIYRPESAGPAPVLIDLHGGPASQHRARFNAFHQYLVQELGVAVIAPNVRGSTGYGQAFASLDDGRKRPDAVRDVGALLDWIADDADLDASRVAVGGASYGGYLALATLTTYPDRVRAGMSFVGISNFVTFLEGTHETRREQRRAEYGDERDAEMRAFLNEISPLTNVDRIQAPLLVGQGQNDIRVPVQESNQIVDAIQSRGGTVWYVLAEDEGHGFRKEANSSYFDATYVWFLKQHLLAPATASAPQR